MNQKDEPLKSNRWRRWLNEHTRLSEFVCSLYEAPASGVGAWVRTTAGIVAMLLAIQVITGTLLAFYYVPSTDAAHATVAFIEKVLPAGAWMRALHHYGSQWLTLFLVLHLTQMFWRASYRQRPVAWLGTVFLLALVLAGGVTGYSLPWDARAFFGTRVAEGLAAGLPLIGGPLQRWLIGGTEIGTMTLSRFFGLHVLFVPFFVLLSVAARVFIFRDPNPNSGHEVLSDNRWRQTQLIRQSIAAGLVFLALALFASKYHAPLGPQADAVSPGFQPRPGAQFLWLFQMLKYVPGGIASIVAAAVPKLIFIGLIVLPFLDAWQKRKQPTSDRRRRSSVALFSTGCLLIAFMTAMAYVNDARDPVVRERLAKQAAEEAEFRSEPFEPLSPRSSMMSAPVTSNGGSSMPKIVTAETPPEPFLKKCASCHGARGQGVKPFPTLLGVSNKPRRTVEDIIGLLNDPKAFGLEPPMKTFATKLTDDEKRQIAEWLMLLKKS